MKYWPRRCGELVELRKSDTGTPRYPRPAGDDVPYLIKSCVRENTLMIGTDCGLGGRVHPQIAWAKLRACGEGAAIASEKLWS
jgi:5-methyltetrahydropteroyltriglutamate--homocysteine methyltransferase